MLAENRTLKYLNLSSNSLLDAAKGEPVEEPEEEVKKVVKKEEDE